VAGLSLFLAAVLAATLVVLLVRDDSYEARPPRSEALGPQPARAAVALHRLERSLARGDAVAAARLAPRGDTTTRRLLGELADNARELEVTDLSLRYLSESGGSRDDGSWPASVDLSWRYAGIDAAPARTELQVDFVAEGERVAITGVGGGGRTPVWLAGGARVTRTPRLAVVGAGRLRAGAARRYVRPVRAAPPPGRAVLPRRPGGRASGGVGNR